MKSLDGGASLKCVDDPVHHFKCVVSSSLCTALQCIKCDKRDSLNGSLHFIGTFPPSLQCIVGRSWRGFPCAACAGAADQSRWSARRSQLLVELSTVCHKSSQILNLASGFLTRRFSLVTCRWLPDQAVATSRILSVHSIYVCVPQIHLAIGCTTRIQL